MPDQPDHLSQALEPVARRLILFHLVPEGECVLRLPGRAQVQLYAGARTKVVCGHLHSDDPNLAQWRLPVAGHLLR